MSQSYELETDADISWPEGVNPEDWRNLPDVDGDDESLDNDESLPCPQYVEDILGFDPDDEDWEDGTTENKQSEWYELIPGVENAFCPTGKGGGVDPTCSPGSSGGSFPGHTEKKQAVDSRMSEVQERIGSFLKKLGEVKPNIILTGDKEFKESTDLFNGHFDKETSTIKIAAGGLPASGSKLAVGQFSLGQSVSDVAVHEYGHQILEKMIETNIGSPGRLINIWRMAPKKQLISKVSQYAASHPSEMFAEAFLAYTHPSYGKRGGPKLSKDLEGYMKELFG